VLLAATAQNIKKIALLLSRMQPSLSGPSAPELFGLIIRLIRLE
jgi:hypothetical protein